MSTEALTHFQPLLRVPTRPTKRHVPLLGLVGLAILAGILPVASASSARFLIGIFGALIFFLIATRSRDFALALILVWLCFLGFTRRALIPFAGWSPQDPLILVAPACAVMLWLGGRKHAPRVRSAMATIALMLLGWSFAQALNPSHLTALEGAYGSLFWAGPLLWFFVGRTLEDRHYDLIARALTFLLIPVLAHGLYQTFFGFLPFEYTWLGVSGFGESIFLDGFKIRPFSTLVSPQEYGFFLSFALTIVWTRMLATRRRRGLNSILFAAGTLGLFLQGSRSIFALFLLMLLVSSLIWLRSPVARVGILLFALSIVSYAVLGRPPAQVSDSAASALASHQLSGLMDPTGSTLTLHAEMVKAGFDRAWEHPLGLGTGVTTIATAKVGKKEHLSTENDLASTFVSLGIPGGLGFSIFIVATFAVALRRFARQRSWRSLAMISHCIATFGYWWSGGMYAVSAMLWLVLGLLARGDPSTGDST